MTFLCLYSLKQGYQYMQTVAWIKHGTPVCCATVLRDGFLYTPHFPKKNPAYAFVDNYPLPESDKAMSSRLM